ncbi:TatD family hydrolase [Thiomicrorhabdus sp. Kp2]|uniref:TatD family hydrolase n=1 Tax=Thiomicrorhabdus sp. Kp2 TaxID=1123518 RepID=UPI0009DBD623|nr:TatD family hydrolase [Thiomicrorhabdus sp. Kp2]
MFDTHCHLNAFYSSSDHSYFHSHSANRYLAVSTKLLEWQPTLDFSDSHDNVYAALGIHPWFVEKSFDVDLIILKSLLTQNKIHAIGEIGLDFGEQFRQNKSLQLSCFEQQLAIALKHQLPVSLHAIKSHNEMIALLKQYSVQGVVHGLGSSVQIAQQYIDLGLKFGVNGVSLRDNARRYHELVRHFGLAHIVLETDYPNIKLPGLVDSSLDDIYSVAKHVAKLLSVSVKDVINQTDYNAKQLFNG